MHDRFRTRYGPVAVIAGASEGLGEAFAVALASRGINLLLVARRERQLAQLASRLSSTYGVDVRPVVADLSDPGTPQRIADEAAGADVGLLVYNAAASSIGPFLTTPMDAHRQALTVNAVRATELVHLLGTHMLARERGGIVLMTSLSAFRGSALIATYAATKAYLLSLAEALSYELRGRGIDVLAVCAGATRTPGYVASRPRNQGALAAPEMEAEEVVDEALAALGRKSVVVTGSRNRLSHLVLSRLLPRSVSVRVMGYAMDRLYGTDPRRPGSS